MARESVPTITRAINIFLGELSWREKTENPLYFMAKLQEEVGELAEAALAIEGSSRKIKKLQDAGVTPRERFLEEISDILNIVLLYAKQNDVSVTQLFETASKKMLKKSEEIHGKKENS